MASLNEKNLHRWGWDVQMTLFFMCKDHVEDMLAMVITFSSSKLTQMHLQIFKLELKIAIKLRSIMEDSIKKDNDLLFLVGDVIRINQSLVLNPHNQSSEILEYADNACNKLFDKKEVQNIMFDDEILKNLWEDRNKTNKNIINLAFQGAFTKQDGQFTN
jgi:hypothetical protein